MLLNDQISNNATQTREEASGFEKDLKQKFDMLSEKTTENLNRSNEMLEVAKQQVKLENDIANSVAVITAMFSKNALLESTVMPQVVSRLRIKPPKPIDETSQDDANASPPPAQAPTPNNPQWWEFWKPKNNNSNSTSTPSSVSSPSVGNIKPPPSNLSSGGFTPAQSYSDSTAKEKDKIKKSMISYSDVIQKSLEASGISAISILGDFISSTGGLGGFFKPYIKTIVDPFAESMGVSSDLVDRLVTRKVDVSENILSQQQKHFGKTWGKFLNDDNFIAKFITRESLEDLDKQPPLVTATGETNLAAFVATLESSQLQDQADVFQSMLNRAGQNYNNYGGLFNQLTAPNQYSPLSAIIHGTSDPAAQARYGPIAATLGSNPQERISKLKEIISKPDALSELENLYQAGNAQNASKLLQDFYSRGELSKESARFIRGRTDFGARPGVGGAVGGNEIRRSSNTFGGRGANLPPSSLESGGFKNVANNISKIFSPLVISGPNSGYPILFQGNIVTMHGMEIVIPYGQGYYVLPVKNDAYSFKNPEELLGRWYRILSNNTRPQKAFAAGGRLASPQFWQMVAISAREDMRHPQGQADVAQSIYNRVAIGSYPGGRNVTGIITAPGQYQPTFTNPGAWSAIKDRQTAIAAAGKGSSLIDMAVRSITNPSLQRESARFVGGRTDFMGESQKPYMKSGDITRGKNHNFFGWFYDARLPKPAPIPKFVSSQTSATATSNRTENKVVINRSGGGSSSSPNIIQQSTQFITDTVKRFNPLQFMYGVQRGRS